MENQNETCEGVDLSSSGFLDIFRSPGSGRVMELIEANPIS